MSLDATSFVWPVRVYYEDTDAAGIVYYANYLKFFERCRTEWLRALGIDQRELAAQEQLQFVVRGLQCEYLRPASLDDELQIDARITRLRGASLEFAQQAVRGSELLARSTTRVACVNVKTLAPQALPQRLLAALNKRSDEGGK